MKKILLFTFILICTMNIYSQNLSYGFLIGANYHDGEVENSSNSVSDQLSEKPNIHIGGFVDYQFSKRLGIKLNTQYNRIHEKYRFSLGGTSYISTFSLNSIQLIPHLKFDVETEYNKGFYFLTGPRISFIIAADDQSGNDVKDFYKSSNFGVQFGFGINIAKKFAVEVLGDYGFSDVTEAEPIEIRTAGIYINFNVKSRINYKQLMLFIETIRKDFPILSRKVNGNPLVYLDSAATSQTPQQVIDVIVDYYSNYNANIHRGVHTLSQEATDKYESARQTIQTHFNAKHAHEIIFTSGTTHSINLVANGFSALLKKGDEVIVSALEHHSNIVPWQMLCERTNAILKSDSNEPKRRIGYE